MSELITAADALQQFQNANMPKINELDPSVYDRPPLFIFNIYGRQHVVTMSYKTFVVPPCAEGEDYSAPCVIPGMVHDFKQVPGDTLELTPVPIPGNKVADDVLGIYGDAANNLMAWGCFLSKSDKPAKKDLETAKARLVERLNAMVNSADRLFNGNQAERDQIGVEHRRAAKYLHLARPWMNLSMQMDECPACGTSVKPGLAVCPHCTAVLDEKKARQFFPDRFKAAA